MSKVHYMATASIFVQTSVQTVGGAQLFHLKNRCATGDTTI